LTSVKATEHLSGSLL